jgi:hypothetical protein
MADEPAESRPRESPSARMLPRARSQALIEAARALRREAGLTDVAPARARSAGPAKPRGQVIHALLSHSLPLQARFEDIARLPPEHWDAAVFETLNPRAFFPVQEAASLLHVLGKTAAVRAFRAWSDHFGRADVFDEERDRLSARAFRNLLSGGYAWLPALAWILDRMPWGAVVELCRIEFGQDASQPPSANARYQFVELAILRENLMRTYAPIEQFWMEAFSMDGRPARAAVPEELAPKGREAKVSGAAAAERNGRGNAGDPAERNGRGNAGDPAERNGRGNAGDPAAPFPQLAYRVLHLARVYVAHTHGQPARYEFSGPGPKDDSVLAQGSLGHILTWPALKHATQRRAQAVLRQKADSLPDWTKLLLRVAT